MEFQIVGITISWVNMATWISFGVIAGVVVHLFSSESTKLSLPEGLLLGVLGSISGGSFATFLYGIGMKGIDLTSLSVSIAASLSFLTLYQVFSKSNSSN